MKQVVIDDKTHERLTALAKVRRQTIQVVTEDIMKLGLDALAKEASQDERAN